MLRICCIHLLFWICAPALAANAPAPLDEWKQWILDGHNAERQCPYRSEGISLIRHCVWAAGLALELNDSQLEFELSVATEAEVWVQLPGDQRHWPSSVWLGDEQLPVVPNPATPAKAPRYPGVMLEAGEHRISGAIPVREAMPSIRVPDHRGLVTLIRDGRQIAPVDIDNNNRLWLNRKARAADGSAARNSASAKVFRKLTDEVPMTLETQLQLSVAGAARELIIGQILPPGAILTEFQSELPARVEKDGLLKMQVRAGRWTVTAKARYTEPCTAFGFDQHGELWPDQEIWSFEARPQLRGVKLSGAVSIDPSQLSGPAQWRQLPTYRLSSGQQLQIEERYRGEVAAPPNKLSVHRTVWMDFDGHGATVQDHLQGQMQSGWRLSAAADVALGRASVNQRPQVITRLDDGSKGVEIRDPDIALETVSRLQEPTRFSASGWQQDVDTLSTDLLLPPGWKIWHIAGPDSVSNSWLSSWNLWDIFICLLVVAVTANVLGRGWSVLAVVLLALTYHDATSTLAACALLLFAIGFVRVLPAHRFRQLMLSLCFGLSLLVLASLLSFSVTAIREAIYPQLEYHHSINTGYTASTTFARSATSAGAPQELMREMSDYAESRIASAAPRKMKSRTVPQTATPENIQTGPGVPTWQWHRASLHWSGPVSAQEQIAMYLTPPPLTRILHLVQVVLLLAFAGRLLRALWQLRAVSGRPAEAGRKPGSRAIGSAALLLLLIALPQAPVPAHAAADFPPEYLLKEYERRLLKQPDCGWACYAVNQVQVMVRDDRLEVRLQLSVRETLGVPLPKFSQGWQPERLTVDGEPTHGLTQQQGQWYVLLQPGVRELVIQGKLYSEEMTLGFERAHNVSVNAPGFEVTGLIGNRLQSRNLTLRRNIDLQRTDKLFPDPIAPFVRVDRHLSFDQEWVIDTTVTRMAPANGAIHLNVPLLEGEKIRVEGIESRDGQVAVSLGNKQRRVRWQSTIEPQATYTLRNRSTPAIAEHWSLDASPRWRVETSGLAVIKAEGGSAQRQAQMRWRPHPGETVTIAATRPLPVDGPTTTVESAKWSYIPGERSAIAQLDLRIRSSIGRDYSIEPPADGKLEQLLVDGEDQILPDANAPLAVPLHPGLQQVTLRWRLASGVDTVSRTPALTLGSPPSNIDLEIKLPRDRWPLMAGGPTMGPAVLFWSILIVMLIVALILSRVIRRQQLSIPLRSWHWMLLILGLSTVNAVGSLWVLAWFFVLEAKGRYPAPESRLRFNLLQLGIAALTLISALVLLATIPQSLLSFPDMQVQGNGSHNYLYRWYQDHSDGALPGAWVFSLPIWAYRATMLIWSLWLVFALIRWIRWGWARFSTHGWWRARQRQADVPQYLDDSGDQSGPQSKNSSEDGG